MKFQLPLNKETKPNLSINKVNVKLATVAKGDPKASFSLATTPGVEEGTTPFPGLLHFTLDLYLITLNVNKGGIKYYFLSLWYDSIRDGTPVSWAIG